MQLVLKKTKHFTLTHYTILTRSPPICKTNSTLYTIAHTHSFVYKHKPPTGHTMKAGAGWTAVGGSTTKLGRPLSPVPDTGAYLARMRSEWRLRSSATIWTNVPVGLLMKITTTVAACSLSLYDDDYSPQMIWPLCQKHLVDNQN